MTPGLSRRERQVMGILQEGATLSVHDVRGRLPAPPGASSVRTVLRRLEAKHLVRRSWVGSRCMFAICHPPVATHGTDGPSYLAA